jgi:glycosyltransferase involved in cell wall biosynthesis
VLVFFGSIRAYKNVPHLIRVFRKLSRAETYLVVAGEPTRAERTAVLAAAEGDKRVITQLRLIPAAEVQVILRSADLVVLPFRDILNSGSALLALSFDRPVLVPDLGSMREIQQLVGDTWLRTYDGVLDENRLLTALDWALHTPRAEKPQLDGLDWSSIARRTLSAYNDLLRASSDARWPSDGL